MRRMLVRGLWLLCGLALVVAGVPGGALYGAPPVPAEPAALNRELMGMVVRDPWYDFGTHPAYPGQPNYVAQERMGARLADMGVRWVRLEFRIEGTQEEIEAQIARNDYFINSVAPRYNLKVLGLLSFGLVPIDPLDPEYGLVAAPTYVDPLYGGGVNDYMRTWLDRARMIVARYGDRVAAYQILNEQNRMPPSGDPVPAAVAARLHTKFYRFFHQVDRYAPQSGDQSWRDEIAIVLGGLHPAGSGKIGADTLVSDRDYLRELYASDGFVSYRETYGRFPIDGLGYHPYPEEIRVSLQSSIDIIGARLDDVRATLNELGDPQLPFWITEIGYNPGFRQQSETGQALFLRETFATLSARSDIATVFWFKYEDFPATIGPGGHPQLWGVVSIPFTSGTCPGGACYAVDGEPTRVRPSYLVYRELAGLPIYRVYLPLTVR